MKIYDSKIWRVMEVGVDFFLLNFLWLALCLPIVTIAPATAALFAVMRDWVRYKEPGGFAAFFTYLKENFLQSLLVGAVWTLLGILLGVNLLLGLQMTSPIRYPSVALTGAIGMLYLLVTPYLFPVMVHYRTSWTGVIRNSFAVALNQPIVTLLALLTLGSFVFLALIFPFTLLLGGSVTAYLIYLLCDKAFQRIGNAAASAREEEREEPADDER